MGLAVLEAVATGREGAGRVRAEQARWRARAQRALPLAVTVVYVTVGWARRWAVDDAFINYRVVKQIEAGNGPIFNLGERVEVTTSTLWLVVLTVGDLLSPFQLEWTALVLELALGAFGLAAGTAGALRLARLRRSEPGGWIVPLGAVAYLAVAATWDWATGGLENGLALGWLGATFWAVVALVGTPEVSRRQLVATAVLAGLGLLVRPDFLPFYLGFMAPIGWTAWSRGRARSLLLAVAAALAFPAAVQLFRMGYYGQLLPNTYYAKEGARTWWSQGWDYLLNFANPYLLVVPATLTLAWLALSWRPTGSEPQRADDHLGSHHTNGFDPVDGVGADGVDADSTGRNLVAWRLVVVALELGVLLHVLAIVRVGGDYMHGRLLQPTWFALLLPLLAVRLTDLRVPRQAMLGVALVAWAGVAAVAWRPPIGNLINVDVDDVSAEALTPNQRGGVSGVVDGRELTRSQSLDDQHMVTLDDMQAQSVAGLLASGLGGPPHYRETAAGVGEPINPDVGRHVVAVPAVGAISYALPLDLWVYDRHGLGDVMVARVDLDSRGSPGHEKLLPAPWEVARFVDPSVAVDPADFRPGGLTVLLPGVAIVVDDDDFDAETAAARRALDCGELAEILAMTRADMTPGLFVRNLVDAVRLHDFRYPSNPREAEAALCEG